MLAGLFRLLTRAVPPVPPIRPSLHVRTLHLATPASPPTPASENAGYSPPNARVHDQNVLLVVNILRFRRWRGGEVGSGARASRSRHGMRLHSVMFLPGSVRSPSGHERPARRSRIRTSSPASARRPGSLLFRACGARTRPFRVVDRQHECAVDDECHDRKPDDDRHVGTVSDVGRLADDGRRSSHDVCGRETLRAKSGADDQAALQDDDVSVGG